MASPASAKKQIVESIKEATNILVTVSNNPSVDELSAAIGLTAFLNKLDKHATAVASGQMPPAITFLEPDKIFEESADSLRDFIIALDKDKADHLRYKLDGDVVKIFITPYRTTISSDDLDFSQGDYNVELVLALNVASSDELDAALSAHGKILHDATVATVTAGELKSSLGTIDWHDGGASSVSEMAAEIAEALKTPKAVLDEQISTALLTGIVAATERFSNNLTSSRVMTIAAELMAAGANQQLIAAKLEEAGDLDVEEPAAKEVKDEATKLKEGESTKVETDNKKADKKSDDDGAIGVMKISHAREGGVDDVARQVMEESQEDAARVAELKLDKKLAEDAPTATEPQPVEEQPAETPEPEIPAMSEPVAPPVSIMEDLKQATSEAAPTDIQHEGAAAEITGSVAAAPNLSPSIGGTLNATTEQAAEDKRREAERSQNRTILTHGKPVGDQAPTFVDTPMNASMLSADEPPSIDVFASAPASEPTPPELPKSDDQSALLAEALSSASQAPQLEPLPTTPTLADIEAGATAPTLAPQPAFPAMPDFSNLPPLPPAPVGVDINNLPPLPTVPQATDASAPAQDFNPSQFQIPDQQ